MSTVRGRLEAVARRGLVSCWRGLALAVVSQLVCVPLFIAVVLAIAFTPLWIGVPLTPAAVLATRRLTGAQRRWARDWSGVAIGEPYRPPPAAEPSGRAWLPHALRRWAAMTRDPATWRDLLWTLTNAPVGLVLGLLPVSLVGLGVQSVLVTPWLGFGPLWPVPGAGGFAWLAAPAGALVTLGGLAAAPAILRAHARFSRSLLGPTRQAELAGRVRRLTETRAGAVDASAAELRRIERDLHDGTQARLAALGMNLGLAEDLFGSDPQAAQQLLSEARQASGQALAELRNLVRGIHPPVLAERGLVGALSALALSLPIPVEVAARLPGRPPPPVESAAYFAVAECLANVVKHSAADRVWVRLTHAEGRLTITVDDDGVGAADPDAGTGLRGIQRRLAAFDGTIMVTSPPGGPTAVILELPCALSSPRT